MTPFSYKLHGLRTALGLSLTALGKLAELDLSTISRYENGSRRPGEPEAKKLAAALKVDLVELALDCEWTLVHPDGLTIGARVTLGHQLFIDATGGVTIEDDVVLEDRAHISSRLCTGPGPAAVIASPVVIEAGAILGPGCFIGPGVHVPRGTRVDAYEVVAWSVE